MRFFRHTSLQAVWDMRAGRGGLWTFLIGVFWLACQTLTLSARFYGQIIVKYLADDLPAIVQVN
jgi:hypothetical protein